MCIDCKARLKMARDALIAGKIGGTIVHVAKGAAEMAGIKDKTGAAELGLKESKRKPAKQDPGKSGY